MAFRRAVQAGRWKATQTAPVPSTRGYHLDAFTSPFESLPTIVRTWKRASKHHKQTGSLADVIAFQCGRLALPYRAEPAQGVTPELIARSCREAYENVPGGACVLVGAVDVQDNRLEAELSGWGLLEVNKRRSRGDGRARVGVARVPRPATRRALVSAPAMGDRVPALRGRPGHA